MLFLDSSDVQEIRALAAWGVLSGITTNRLLMAREGVVDLDQRIRQILEVSSGPVSVELTEHGAPGMLAEAARLVELAPDRVLVKVPFSEEGLTVTHQLRQRGVPVNVTACMSLPQAVLASLAGARFVSIFSGRIRDMGYDARGVIESVRALFDRQASSAQLLVGSIRHPMDVTEALLAGAHVVTVPPAILRKMLHNPKTEETVREFADAWAQRPR